MDQDNLYDLNLDDVLAKERQQTQDLNQCFRWLATRSEFYTALKWIKLQAGKPIGFNTGDKYHSYYSGVNDTFKLLAKLLEEQNHGI